MLETGGILIVMGAIFALGAVGEGILSLFYRRYLRDTADMGRPGKKLVKLTKLRYETSYYLNGTVHNAKTMVDGMLEHYRLAGMRLWTWHHISTLAAFLCGVIGFAIGGAYVAGRYIPEVKERLPLSGTNALIYTLAGGALAVMLLFWQNLLDNRTKRQRIESNLVDYFDNEKFHQLGREIALSGRVREIAGDRGRREDPGSIAVEQGMTAREESAVTGNQSGMPEEEKAGSQPGTAKKKSGKSGAAAAKTSGKKDTAVSGKAAAKAEQTVSVDLAGRTKNYESYEGNGADPSEEGALEVTERSPYGSSERFRTESERWELLRGSGEQPNTDMPALNEDVLSARQTSGGMTIGDIISPDGTNSATETGTAENGARGRSTARKKTGIASARSRAKNVQIAQEEMEERKVGGSRRKEKASRDVIIPLNPEGSPTAKGTTVENGEEPEKRDGPAEMEAAATMAAVPASAKRRRPAGMEGNTNGEDAPGNLYGEAGRDTREEELLRLLREYMGL